VAKRAGPVSADSRMLSLVAAASLSETPSPAVILIPGGMGGTFAAARDPEILEWVRTAHRASRWTTSVCSGALILGSAGLLAGRRAATHWLVANRLSRYGATYVPERVVEEGRVVTAQGVSAGIDMGLRLASRIADRPTAEAIQLALEYDPQPPFDTGSLAKAGPQIRRRATSMLGRQFLKEKGSEWVRRLGERFTPA
jgi:transcriptional regulator GlxA family with amidase domain